MSGIASGSENAQARALRAEQALAEARPFAEAGRFVLSMRHDINNSLSSVLGNAELLLLESAGLGAGARRQVEMIYAMGTRLYEIMQQMAALEKEARIRQQEAGTPAEIGLAQHSTPVPAPQSS